MTEFIHHPTYGDIVYTENFWIGKKTLTVNGLAAQQTSKKTFLIDGHQATVNGGWFTGATLTIESETIELARKPAWYEVLLAIVPLLFLLTWGNVPALCAIFPVIGGAIGGGLGALAGYTSLMFMKKSSSPIARVLIGLGAFVVTVLVAFILAMLLILFLA